MKQLFKEASSSSSSSMECALFCVPLQQLRRSLVSVCFFIPTSLLILLLLFLLSYNGASIFCIQIPFPAITSPERGVFFPENPSPETTQKWSSPYKSSALYALKEELPPSKLKTQLLPLQKSDLFNYSSSSSSSSTSSFSSVFHKPKWVKRNRLMLKNLQPTGLSRQFATRAKEFFSGYGLNSKNSSCKVRLFMTWISPLDSFGVRELFSLQSVFKSHPNACLLIVSSSMDSSKGTELLKPFQEMGFRVIGLTPDFDYLFKNTLAQDWFDRLREGKVDPGDVSLGQNLSNLLRLAVLYKFGGIYIDTDVIVLRSFVNFRNVIGAQTVDLETGNWSRLNNAVMIFKKKHPLLLKFIEEFALTFDGNKWGHNGPYLVSRVVSRITGRTEFNFTVLPPVAFYPVDWSRVRGFFNCPRDVTHLKWIYKKLKQIQKESFAIHLWNKQSRHLKVEEGSIIYRLMLDSCIFCNSLAQAL